MLEIREALPSDAEAILEYCKAVGGESDNLTFGSEGLPLTAQQERKYLDQVRNAPRQTYLVALMDGDIVGTGALSGSPRLRLSHRAELNLSVRKALWSNHIGSRLLDALISFARTVPGLEILSLEVRSDNARAIALYRKFGFEIVGTFPGYLKINGTEISCDFMRLHL